MSDHNNVIEMDEGAYEKWLRECAGIDWQDTSSPSEENMVEILSNAIRTDNVEMKARQFIDLANMALAMADKTLGCQSIVATSLVLTQH